MRRAVALPSNIGEPRTSMIASTKIFDQHFVQQLLAAVRPEIEAMIRDALVNQTGEPLIVNYEEAGRLIGTTYEGIRKLVRTGRLIAVSRSGRHRGIAVSELKNYVERSQLIRTSSESFSAGWDRRNGQ